LYDEPIVSQIQLDKLAIFLKETFLVQVETRDNILKFSKKDTAAKVLSCMIGDTKKPNKKNSSNETHDKIKDLKNEIQPIYDGFELQGIFTELIPDKERLPDLFHVFFTDKLTCTFDYDDYRYHGRALIGANPSIISTTGIIEAPAKSREYYFDLMTTQDMEAIKQKYKGTFLEYNDPRLSKIIEGYLLQAIFYFETGNAFCDKKECRLYNAHWQKELLDSQVKKERLCDAHQEVLKKLTMK